MRLSDYLTDRNIPNADFAKAIGVSVQALSRYRLGRRRPEWDVLERIRIATADAVMPNDFMTVPQVEPISAGAAA